MEFESTAQRACYNRIVPWMQDLFGEAAVLFEDEPLFIVTIGSAVASTRVVSWENNDALITTRSFVVTDIDVTPGAELLSATSKQRHSFRSLCAR